MGLMDKKAATPSTPQATEPDMFDKVAEGKGSYSSVYPLEGIYPILRIDTLKVITTREDRVFFVADIEIIKSIVQGRPNGSCMTWMAPFDNEAARNAIKSFIAAVVACKVEAVTGADIREACGEGNPAHGRLVRLEATTIETKKTKQPFTKCQWSSLADEIQTQTDILRTEAGFL